MNNTPQTPEHPTVAALRTVSEHFREGVLQHIYAAQMYAETQVAQLRLEVAAQAIAPFVIGSSELPLEQIAASAAATRAVLTELDRGRLPIPQRTTRPGEGAQP